MEKKKTTEKVDVNKSKSNIFATPIAKRILNATYVKSESRLAIPNKITSRKNAEFFKHSKNLIELGLAESEWETYRINALYGVVYIPPMLRHYEVKLKAIVEAKTSEKGSKSQYYNLKFQVEIHYFHDMKFTKNDFPPLKITIGADDGNENDVYFTGVLLSVDRKEGFMEQERLYANATILPLFLACYTDNIFFDSVKYFLESSFSCYISQLKFSSYDLMWMLALFCPKDDQSNGVTHIEYVSSIKELKTIQLHFDPYTVAEVWNNIIGSASAKEQRIITEKQVYDFINCLEHHFFKTFKINLSELDLNLIRTPLATVTANHSIQINETEKLYFVVRHLTHLAQETPALAISKLRRHCHM